VVPGATADLGRPAPRPAYSVLGTERNGTPRLPDWHDGLQDFLAAGVPS
jgi:dTDP-4-dehydrorhamnose reductase